LVAGVYHGYLCVVLAVSDMRDLIVLCSSGSSVVRPGCGCCRVSPLLVLPLGLNTAGWRTR
jgi:hypothetical protein